MKSESDFWMLLFVCFFSFRQRHFPSWSWWTNWLPVFSYCQAASLRCQPVRFESPVFNHYIYIIFFKSITVLFAIFLSFLFLLSLAGSSKMQNQSTLKSAPHSSTVKPVTPSPSTLTQQTFKPPVAKTKTPGRVSMTFPEDSLIISAYCFQLSYL